MPLKSIKLIVFVLLMQNTPTTNKSIQARDTMRPDCQLPLNPLDSQTLWTSIEQKIYSRGQSPAGIKKARTEIGVSIICDYLLEGPPI